MWQFQSNRHQCGTGTVVIFQQVASVHFDVEGGNLELS
jgi:hypothetical protein